MASGTERCRRPLVPVVLASLLLAAAGCGGGGGGDDEGSTDTTEAAAPDVTGALAVSAPGADVTTVTVPATSNIFGAGQAEPPAPGGGSGGTPPLEVAVTDNEVVEFPSVTGLMHCCGEAPSTGPDGYAGITDLDGVAGIAGYRDDVQLALVGVFLGPDAPAGEPTPVDFSGNHTFEVLSPGPAQPFFIGDGRDAAGALQRFEVPDGATRLFLGIADGFNFQGGAGHYGDDNGAFEVQVRATGVTDGLVLNGGFETFVVDASSVERCEGSSGITGWDVAGGCVEQITTDAHGGQQAVLLGTDDPGTLSTTVATEVGATYTLSFWLGALEGSTTATGSVSVTGFEDGALAATPGVADPGWAYFEVTFVAAGESTEIGFAGAGRLAVDDVGLAAT